MAELSISLLILLDCKSLFIWKKKKFLQDQWWSSAFPFCNAGNSVTYSPSVKSCNFSWEIHLLTQVKFQKEAEIFWATRTLKCLFVCQHFLLFNKMAVLGWRPTSLSPCWCCAVMMSSGHCPACAAWAPFPLTQSLTLVQITDTSRCCAHLTVLSISRIPPHHFRFLVHPVLWMFPLDCDHYLTSSLV